MTTHAMMWRGPLNAAVFLGLLSAIFGATPAYCAETQSHADAEDPNCAQVAVHRSLMLLGIPVNMDVIALRMPSGPSGNSLLAVRDVLEWIGVKSKGYRTTLEELQKGPFPVIVHYREHFVVVAKALPGFLYVYDGSGRPQLIDTATFKGLWDGTVLVMTPPRSTERLPSFLPEPEEGEPRIRFDTLMIDKGSLEDIDFDAKTGVDFEFAVRNVGKGDLVIGSVRSNCRCAVVNKPSAPLKQGQSTVIKVRYNPSAEGGAFIYTVFLECNDPTMTLAVLTIAGRTKVQVDCRPSLVDFGRVVVGTTAARAVRLVYNGDQPLVVTEVSGPTCIRAQVHDYNADTLRLLYQQALLPQKVRKLKDKYLEVMLTAEGPLGVRRTEELVVRTNIMEAPEVKIPVRFIPIDNVAVVPSTVLVDLAGGTSQISGTCVVRMLDRTPFEIVALTCENDDLSLAFPAGKGQVSEIAWKYSAHDAPKLVDSTLVIRYLLDGDTEERSTSIPVYGYDFR